MVCTGTVPVLCLEAALTTGLCARYLQDIEVQPPLSPSLLNLPFILEPCVLFSPLPPSYSFRRVVGQLFPHHFALQGHSLQDCLFQRPTLLFLLPTVYHTIPPSLSRPPLCSTDWPGNPPDFPLELVLLCSWGGFFSFSRSTFG